ncbi:hypothetical protein HR45_08270 [Shewanella mangrovi]|uniref:Chorismate lyase n=1 Tax=Shewanella mangrovi TaxID=1515746 RepID=A0A094JD94_9GAMM|nr:hypothetical protein [Shewanella mangrovi]KFZ37840.1 hypothetical protein HR45_08270 [Shewanella mangrovi]
MAVGAKGFIRLSWISFSLLAAQVGFSAHAVSLSIPPLMTAPEMLVQLNQQLILTKNAPATLNYWCKGILADEHGVEVSKSDDAHPAASDEIRKLLGVDAATPVQYLKLNYQCHHKVIAVFEHWYLPQLLPAKVKQLLLQDSVSLGRELRRAGFYRQSISNKPMWPDSGALPTFVLQHQALWYRSDKTPFSLVNEHYTRQLLPLAQQGQVSPY